MDEPIAETVKQLVQEAFANVEFPGDWCLRGSNEDEEPFLLEQEFAGKDDWRTLDPAFLDDAPGGYGSALSFFSDEAFRFYLPAYLIADVDGLFERQMVEFHLTHGLRDADRDEKVNERRYGERTWLDFARYKFAIFNVPQARAIVAYLRFKRSQQRLERLGSEDIDQALANYWLERSGLGGP